MFEATTTTTTTRRRGREFEEKNYFNLFLIKHTRKILQDQIQQQRGVLQGVKKGFITLFNIFYELIL